MNAQESIAEEWAQEQASVELRRHARAYLRKGWQVVPLWWPSYPLVCACPKGKNCGRNAGKHPGKTDWVSKPLETGLDVDLWWERKPLANIGLATGAASGFVVVDIDPDHGGWDSYNRIVKHYGALPQTPVSITGSGGRHVLFRHPGGGATVKNAIGCLPGIDIRGDGGQIVAPPSLHSSGARYEWHPKGHPARVRIAPMPEWLIRLLDIDRRKLRPTRQIGGGRSRYGRKLHLEKLPTVVDGNRNDTLISIVGRLIWEKRDHAEIMRTAHEANRKLFQPPVTDKEVNYLVTQAIKNYG